MACAIPELRLVLAGRPADFQKTTKIFWGIKGGEYTGNAAVLAQLSFFKSFVQHESVRALRNAAA